MVRGVSWKKEVEVGDKERRKGWASDAYLCSNQNSPFYCLTWVFILIKSPTARNKKGKRGEGTWKPPVQVMYVASVKRLTMGWVPRLCLDLSANHTEFPCRSLPVNIPVDLCLFSLSCELVPIFASLLPTAGFCRWRCTVPCQHIWWCYQMTTGPGLEKLELIIKEEATLGRVRPGLKDWERLSLELDSQVAWSPASAEEGSPVCWSYSPCPKALILISTQFQSQWLVFREATIFY